MRVFVYILAGQDDMLDLFAPVAEDGNEIHYVSTAMSAQEVYNEILEADAIVMRHNDDNAESGSVLGLGLAFGKMIYVLSDPPPDNVFSDMEGVVLYNDLYDLLPDLRADLKELKEDGATGPDGQAGGNPVDVRRDGGGSDDPGTTG